MSISLNFYFKPDFNEEVSDRCIALVLGTNDDFPKCSFPSDCVGFMTQRGLYDYGVTHQILYTMFAEMVSAIDSAGEQMAGKANRTPSNIKI